ncbi:Hypothetical predicted protein [Pelobates cultripes]|uniref:Uncharacterized protein n=1 Tax=Pelobates cultripes TaxID=61616 RepID=A0AAD1SWU8_PELCU|nr:Hypothetical predicted protein [Pelobates cultripes]
MAAATRESLEFSDKAGAVPKMSAKRHTEITQEAPALEVAVGDQPVFPYMAPLPPRSMETSRRSSASSDQVWEMLEIIRQDVLDLRNKFEAEFTTLSQKVSVLDYRADETDEVLTEHATEIANLNKRIHSLELQLNSTNTKLSDIEDRSLRNNLRVRRIPNCSAC